MSIFEDLALCPEDTIIGLGLQFKSENEEISTNATPIGSART
jgi:hypothetical protein